MLFSLVTLQAEVAFSQFREGDYFQQDVNIVITVTLDISRHELHAVESIEYVNNSPDSLKHLFFHLWPNAYSDNKTALAKQLFSWQGRTRLFKDELLKGYIDSLDFNVNGDPVSYNYYNGKRDICILELNDIIAPGDTVLIETPFRVRIPAGNVSRLGHTGRSYQISQWFPKPAVYDAEGWHSMEYLDQGEFYSEFGNFKVSITLPEEFAICASGELLSGNEESPPGPFLKSSAVSGKMKTVVYQRDQIHDFAWFAALDYFVMRGKVALPSGKEVITKSFFTSESASAWIYSLEFIEDALISLSEWIGEYPYDSFITVEGALGAGSGMEYPGLAVIGSAVDPYSLDEVIVHEACHSWFYSSIASDERRYPFMDEGITTAYELRYMSRKYPDKKLWEVYFKNRKLARFLGFENVPVEKMTELEWLIGERDNTSQPAGLSSESFTVTNYNNIVYYKAGQGFNYLRGYLGDQTFDRIIHKYYSGWRAAHPQPDDLRRVFEYYTGKDLEWFFEDFIGSTKRFDYSIARIKENQVLIRNNGEMVSPFPVSGITDDSVSFELWNEGFIGKRWIDLPGNLSELQINKDHLIPEIHHLNNNIKTKGLFKKADPVKLHFLYGFEDPGERALYFIPLVNWNRIDGFMPGAAISNRFLLPKPFEFFTLPFYSFRNHILTGKWRLAVNTVPYHTLFRKMTIFTDGSIFGAPGKNKYHLFRFGVDLNIRNNNMNYSPDHLLFGRYINASDIKYLLTEDSQNRNFWQAGYTVSRQTTLDPFSLTTMMESGNEFLKGTIDFRFRYSYAGDENGLDVRLFAGYMFNENSLYPLYSLAPSGRSGRELYLFQGEFPDRYSDFLSGFWSRQMLTNEGGIITPVNKASGYSKWLISTSITGNLPGRAAKIPIRPFLNVLYNGNRDLITESLFFEAGFSAGLRDIFEFHIPLLVSGNIREIQNSVRDRIRFVFNLEPLYNFRLR